MKEVREHTTKDGGLLSRRCVAMVVSFLCRLHVARFLSVWIIVSCRHSRLRFCCATGWHPWCGFARTSHWCDFARVLLLFARRVNQSASLSLPSCGLSYAEESAGTGTGPVSQNAALISSIFSMTSPYPGRNTNHSQHHQRKKNSERNVPFVPRRRDCSGA